MDTDLICNFKKCRKRLNTFAWVTSCSRSVYQCLEDLKCWQGIIILANGQDIFCDEDGSREFSNQAKCPACDMELEGKLDVIRVDLQPSEQYKSMVLAGHRPEVIMEICTRAVSFWTYQAHQEHIYQEYCTSKANEKVQQLESYYKQMSTRRDTEITTLQSQNTALKKELDAVKCKHNELSEKLLDRSRQYQKLQSMYDSLRRRAITPASFENSPSSRNKSTRQFELQLGAPCDKEQINLPFSAATSKGHRLSSTNFIQGRSMLSTSTDASALSSDKTANHLQQLDHGLAAAVDRQALDEN